MKFTIDRDSLKSVLDHITNGIEMNSTLPILSGVLISAEGATLRLEATNMEVSIRQNVIAHVDEPGQIVVPCKLLGKIVNSLPDAAVLCQTEGTQFSVKCGKTSFNLNTMPARDFPTFPEYIIDSKVELPTDSLLSMVNRVAVASSTDKARPLLNGILMSITSNQILFVTTDSLRLAVAQAKLLSEVEDFEVLINSKVLRSVLALASDQKTITVGVNAQQVIFLFGDVVYIARRIEGTYPNYRKLIPSAYVTGIRVKTNDLHNAIQRIKVMTSSNSELCFQVKVDQNLLVITSNLPDQGNAREELAVEEAEGEDIEISFVARYIDDCVKKGADDEYLLLETESPTKPGIFKSLGEYDFLYLVMPVRKQR